MAFTPVVRNEFVNQLIKFVKAMELSNGPFTLAMLVPSESGLADKWNLVVSAQWIDDQGLKSAIPIITSSLLKRLLKINVGKIERVSPLRTDEPIIKELVDQMEVIPGRAMRGESFTLTKRGIPEAIILAVRHPRFSPNSQPQTVRARG